jgi:hypothetical protein
MQPVPQIDIDKREIGTANLCPAWYKNFKPSFNLQEPTLKK